MKHFTFFFLLIFTITVLPQDFQISNMNGGSVDAPHIAIGGNFANVIFGTNFRYFRFDINGPASPNDNPITPAVNFAPNTTDIAVDKNDTNHIAIVYDDFHHDGNTGFSFYATYIVESTDAGTTWDTPTLLDTIAFGNTLDNILYNIPKVKISSSGLAIALWRVHTNSNDTNAVYIGYRYGSKIRVDNPNNSDLELAIGLTVEDYNGPPDWITVSYGKMENSHAKFYLAYSKIGVNPSLSTSYLVKDDGQTFLTSDHFTKAFIDTSGTIKYLYSDFSHGPNIAVSSDWGSSWQDGGVAEEHQYVYIAFDRISPSYYIKLFLNDSNDLVYSVSSNLINWQEGGKLNSNSSSVTGMAGSFIDIKSDAANKFIVSAWIDNRTGSDEIFYGKGPLPNIVTGIKGQKLLPDKFALSQNYPNPFNPSTKIKYQISEPGFVTLNVYDVMGKLVSRLVNKQQAAGLYQINFDGSNLSSGIYFYRLSSENIADVKKMILLR